MFFPIKIQRHGDILHFSLDEKYKICSKLPNSFLIGSCISFKNNMAHRTNNRENLLLFERVCLAFWVAISVYKFGALLITLYLEKQANGA